MDESIIKLLNIFPINNEQPINMTPTMPFKTKKLRELLLFVLKLKKLKKKSEKQKSKPVLISKSPVELAIPGEP